MLKHKRLGNWFELYIPEYWEGKTLDQIFREEWMSPKKLTHFFRMGNKVLVNGNKPNWNEPLKRGVKLQISLFEEEAANVPPTYLEVPVLYEDDHLIVFNKPPFMNTHPNNPETEKDTLLNAAVFYLQSNGEFRDIRHIHRLDRDTTGAILFAKHALSGAVLDKMLERREIKRTYVAMAHGLFKQKKGVIHEPIGRDRHHATKKRVSPTGQDAITHYHIIKEQKNKNISFVKCWLDTGRTHQIRVHFSYKGHPLVGDVLYGGKPLVKRQALHAAKLEFIHPFTKEQIICHAPFIDDPPIFSDIDVFSI